MFERGDLFDISCVLTLLVFHVIRFYNWLHIHHMHYYCFLLIYICNFLLLDNITDVLPLPLHLSFVPDLKWHKILIYIFDWIFRVRECQILLLAGRTKGCFVPPPYLDSYGETDQGLRYCKSYFHKHCVINKGKYWKSQEGPRRALCKFMGAMFKLYQSRSSWQSRSHVWNLWYHWKGMGIWNTYAKYERPVCYSKKVMTNVEK